MVYVHTLIGVFFSFRSYGSMNRRGSIDSVHGNNWRKSIRSATPAASVSLNETTLEQGYNHHHFQPEQQPQPQPQPHQENLNEEQPLTNREIAEVSFTFCILWFAANWATNASLAFTTVASSTILASMSGFFTLAIGAMIKTEKFSVFKLIAVCASVVGVVLVSESDRRENGGNKNNTNNLLNIMGSSISNMGNMNPLISMADPIEPRAPLFGDLLALMSAFFYGCYTVLLKVRIRNESRVNMSLFFGYVGLFNLVLLWPMFGVLHWTGIEPFELPKETKVIWMIVVNALFGTFL